VSPATNAYWLNGALATAHYALSRKAPWLRRDMHSKPIA